MQQNNHYETLISQKITLINDFESGKKRYLKETNLPERPDTPQFSDRKNISSLHVARTNLQIQVNWQVLSDYLETKPYTEFDFLSFMNQLYLIVDAQFWKLCLILAYNEDNWNQQTSIPHDKIMKILGLIFDCVQDINENKIAQVEEVINYRSIAHLDRLLFANKLPQFEKFITIIRQQIQNNPHQAFTLKEAKITEKQFDSFAKMEVQKSYTPTKPSSKGIQRSEMLYNHSKLLQEKARNGYLVRVNQETEQLKSFQKQKKLTADNEVFDRLFNYSKQNKQPQPKEEFDKECTFKPEICTTIVTKSDQKLDQIKGVENTIKRMQKAQNEKEYKEKYFEIKQSQLEKVNNKGVKEFKLSEREENEEPILFLDVRISKNKIGRLGVRRNDDLKQVVQNFAKTFSLQNSQIEALQKHIKSALEMLNKQ